MTDTPSTGSPSATTRPLTEVFVREVEAGACGLVGGEWVDDQPPGDGSDERDVGDVVPARLPDAVADLEQPVNRVEAGLTPESRVARVGRVGSVVPAQEVVVRGVPHRAIVELGST